MFISAVKSWRNWHHMPYMDQSWTVSLIISNTKWIISFDLNEIITYFNQKIFLPSKCLLNVHCHLVQIFVTWIRTYSLLNLKFIFSKIILMALDDPVKQARIAGLQISKLSLQYSVENFRYLILHTRSMGGISLMVNMIKIFGTKVGTTKMIAWICINCLKIK